LKTASLKYYLILLLAAASFIMIPAFSFAGDDPGNNDKPISNDPITDDGLDKPDEVFFTFNYEGVINTILTSYYYKKVVYLPVQSIFDELQINVNYDKESKLINGKFINGQTYEIDYPNLRGKFGENTISFSARDFIEVSGNVYMTPDAFYKLFKLEFKADLNNLILTLSYKEKLPIVLSSDRMKSRESLKNLSLNYEGPLQYDRTRHFINAGFLDYSITANFSKFINPTYNYDVTLGTQLLGGEFRANVKAAVKNEYQYFKKMNFNFFWKYSFNNNPVLNQILAGDLASSGLYNGSYRGLKINNEPAQQQVSFGKYTINETTLPNSDVEVYINNQLYSFLKADALGKFTVSIPITYGSNLVFLKIFSPTGEIIEGNKRIQIPSGILPQGKLFYNLSAGETFDTKKKIFQGDVSYGITDWATLKSGAEYLMQTSMKKPVYYNTLLMKLMDEYYMNVSFSHDLFLKASLEAVYYSQGGFSVNYGKYKQNDVFNEKKIIEEASITGAVPLWLGGSSNIMNKLFAGYTKFDNYRSYNYNFQTSLSLGSFRPVLEYQKTLFQFNDGRGAFNRSHLSMGLLTNLPFLTKLSSLFPDNLISAGAEYSFDQKRLEKLNLSFSGSITRNARLEFNYKKNIINNSSDFNVQLELDLPHTRNYVTAGRNSVSAVLTGSVGFDIPNDKFLFYNRQQVGSGAVSFRMFIDKNGNGEFDHDETLIKDVKVDLRQVATFDKDNNDVLRVTELIPNMKYTVDINESSLKNPMLVPKYKTFSFIADPNIFKPVDIPFYMTSEISGLVSVENGSSNYNFSGTKIFIKNLDDNKIISLSTYFDGGFYFLGLLPGRYTAYIDPVQLSRLNAKCFPEKIDFEVKKGDKNNSIEDINFNLKLMEADK
jgi:hypothetical protein